ncbi:GGDEF domain-containing protein [Mangrovibrevibacter kandeliae]|uniref:GGDEF domain-containing protein n=1 Tax=Mangrovibrevibacter kandeliae TaxID=2968473 RepID=UPI00211810A6|nr:GGDEF domain-containing protein [Aurantimonas sp. CSK15Z-1]MCQ8783015.1 GGDEF domain-containing protein [Aurantimonas sp. CSK15Z-1]
MAAQGPLFLFNPFGLAALGFVLLRLRLKLGEAAVSLWWSIGFLTAAAAFVLEFSRGILEPTVAVFLVNAAFLATGIALNRAVARTYATPARDGPIGVIALVTLGLMMWFQVVHPDTALRIVIGSPVLGLILLHAGLRVPFGSRRPRDHAIRAFFVLLFALLIARSLATVPYLPQGLTVAQYRVSDFYLSMHMAAVMIGLVLAAVMISAVVHDLVEEHRLRSETDPLTGILNRRGFEEQVGALAGTPCGQPLFVTLADIDHFKSVNDRFGHAAGDAVIVGLARLLVSLYGEGAVVGRMGGEEFAIARRFADQREAHTLAEIARGAFAALAFDDTAPGTRFTVSFGIAEVDAAAGLAVSLGRADANLYLAKTRGRDRVVGEEKAAQLAA